MKIKKVLSVLTAMAVVMTSGVWCKTELQTDAVNNARVSVHDPSIIKDGKTYYVFGSHIDAAKSTDLKNWTRFTNGYEKNNNVEFGNLSQNLQKAFAWAGEDLGDCEGGFAVWAPDVIWNEDYVNTDGTKGAYLMYFCTSSTWNTSVIAYASAKTIEGPYTFVDTLIYSGFTSADSYVTSATKNVNRKYTSTNIDELIASGEVTYNNSWFNGTAYNYNVCPNAIDPTIYYDTNGKMYMTYGSWSGGIFTLEMDKTTGKCIHPTTGTTSDGRMVDSYFGTKLIGGYHKSGEGPFIEYNAETGYYYLWVTYGGLLSTGGYNMRVFRSKNPMGPFTDASGKTAIHTASSNLDSTGLKVMGNYKFSSLNTAYMACGHNSVLKDDDGQWYLFYHARFDDGSEYHEVRVHQMYFNAEGWPVTTPFEYAGDVLAEGGYEESDLIGEYEYINHGNGTDGNIINYQTITLNSDYSISGAVTGTWTQAQDSAEAVLTIDGQKYSGYFMAAENESGKKVMTFTAVGNNNQSIWGAKNTAYTGTERATLLDYTNSNAELIMAADTVGAVSQSVYLGESNLLSGVSYYITNQNSGLSLDLPEGSLDADCNIQQWDFNKSWAQQWKLIAVDDTYFRIVPLGDESMCVAVEQVSGEDNINVVLQKYNGAENQLFTLKKSGSSYGILSKCSNGQAGLDVFEWSKENGGDVRQFAYHEYACQLWNIEPVHPKVNSGNYVMKNINSGWYLSAEQDNLVQGEQQVWTITEQEDQSYIIQNQKQKAITIENASAENGANVVLSEYTGDLSQKFKLQCNKDGSYSLLSLCSDANRCLDVYEISTESGANICQWEFWGGDGQKFILEGANTEKEPETVVLYGDANCDGSVTMADIILLNQSISDMATLSEQGKINADVTGDHNADALDVSMIMNYLTGKNSYDSLNPNL